jgi:SulP family sulfate permease
MALLHFLDTKLPPIKGRPFFREIASNAKSGMTVALVSLPLSISLAIAADATPVQGIITAVWAGSASAIFGGSHYNIVGPTGALSGILSYYSVTYGSAIQPILAILTGFLCLAVYASRMDKYLVFIPSAVMHGFTMGVSFIIAANQLNFILGLPKLTRHPEFLANLYETVSNAGKASGFAMVFFLVSFTSLFMLSKKYGKIPWAVVLAVLGIIIGWIVAITGSNTPLKTIQTQYGDLSLSLIMVSTYFSDGGLKSDFAVWTDLFGGAVSITAVAVLETLISARIADRLTKTVFDQPQEVFAVAAANLISGFTGGIPATAALARTALNIKSGATSRASGIVNAVSIMILGTVAFSAFKYLPLPIVGAILVNTAYRMLEINEIILLSKTDMPMFIVALVTMLICIVEDPTMGIVYGTFLAMIRVLFAMLHGHASLKIFKGTQCELQFIFDLNDRSVSKACRQLWTKGEVDAEDIAEQKRREAELLAHSHGSGSSTALAEAAEALHKAREAERIKREKDAGMSTAMAEAIKMVETTNEGMTNPNGHYLAIAPEPVDERLPKVAVYTMAGYFTYVTAQSHLDRVRMLFTEPLTSLPGVDVVVFSLEEVYYADPDAFDAMGDLIGELARAGKTLFMVGFHTRVRKVLEKVPWFHHVLSFRDYGSLLVHLRDIVKIEQERNSTGKGQSIQDFLKSRLAAMSLHVQGTGNAATEFSDEAGHTDHRHLGDDNDEVANARALAEAKRAFEAAHSTAIAPITSAITPLARFVSTSEPAAAAAASSSSSSGARAVTVAVAASPAPALPAAGAVRSGGQLDDSDEWK